MESILIIYSLTFIALIITISAQIYVNTTYNKYSKVKCNKEITGAEIARKILDENNLHSIMIEEDSGFLSDHYDPQKKVLCLSTTNYHSMSIAALSVAAHECGHAIQDKENYTFMRLRASLVPVINLSTYAGYFAILLGIFFASTNLFAMGIIAELLILFFQCITLPVEFDASRRALKQLNSILSVNELKQGEKVLKAAALTYVASVATMIVEIIQLIIRFRGREE